MRVYNTAYFGKMFVQHGMGLGIRRRFKITFYDVILKINHHHIIGFQVRIGNTAGFDGEHPHLPVKTTDIPECIKYQPPFGKFHITFKGFYPNIFIRAHFLLLVGLLFHEPP